MNRSYDRKSIHQYYELPASCAHLRCNNENTTALGSFNNHVDNKGWVGGLKFAIFVHVY